MANKALPFTSSQTGRSCIGNGQCIRFSCFPAFIIFFSLWLLAVPAARSQVAYSGTVVYVDVSKDEVTIAADSRTLLPSGQHYDSECKISAFGDKFAFAMAGVAAGPGWNTHDIARQIWEAQPKSTDALDLVRSVSENWITEMEQIYSRPEIVDARAKHGKGNALANAVFAATDTLGDLAVHATHINFDRRLFEAKGEVRISHGGDDYRPHSQIAAGQTDVIDDFMKQGSPEARERKRELASEISLLPPGSIRRAYVAEKLVEWSILLSHERAKLALPVDVLQLRKISGVHWVSLKPNCARE